MKKIDEKAVMDPASPQFPSYNLPFVEDLWAAWARDPEAVDPAWRAYFESLGRPEATGPTFRPRSIFSPRVVPQNGHAAAPATDRERRLAREAKQDRVVQLVQAYRLRGHLFAKLDPLGMLKPKRPDFTIADFGLEPSDLDEVFTAGGLRATLRELIAHLEETYCRTIGVELAHVEDEEMAGWLEGRMEGTRNHVALSHDEQVEILTDLTDAEVFEQFLHTKFLGAKRFSLEGGESFIPMVELMIRRSALLHGVEEIVIGMARAR